MAKVATRNVGGGETRKDTGERFCVVRDGRVVYGSAQPGQKPNGFSLSEAERHQSSLALPAEIVPVEQVDQFGHVIDSE